MSRVLLFTDDRRFADETRDRLRDHHAVHSASLSSFDAVDARDFGADVIFLDASGNGSAFAVRQRLLHDRALAQVPLVAVTESPQEASLLSAAAMVTKPVTPSALDDVLQRLSSRFVPV